MHPSLGDYKDGSADSLDTCTVPEAITTTLDFNSRVVVIELNAL